MNLLYGMYFPGMYYDPTYILVIIGVVIASLASAKVSSEYKKYSRVMNSTGTTGFSAAQLFLHSNGIYDVRIEEGQGYLSDHFDPRDSVVRLSGPNYGQSSVAAVAIAAHECGHVIQHHTNYAPINIRTALVPIVNFSSTLAWPLFFLGLIFSSLRSLLTVGIVLFLFVVIFQLVTLPVEINASRRGMALLRKNYILTTEEEFSMAKKVLTAAALTYVASVLNGILNLLRLIFIAKRYDND